MDFVNCVNEMKMQEVVEKIEIQENYNHEEIKLQIKEEKDEIVEFSFSEEPSTDQNLLSSDLKQEVDLYLQNLVNRIESTEENREEITIKNEMEEIVEFQNTEASLTSEQLLRNDLKKEVGRHLQIILKRIEFPEKSRMPEMKSQIKNVNEEDMKCSHAVMGKSDQEETDNLEMSPLVEEVAKNVEQQIMQSEKKDPKEEIVPILQKLVEEVEFNEGSGYQLQPLKQGKKNKNKLPPGGIAQLDIKRKRLSKSSDVTGCFTNHPKKTPKGKIRKRTRHTELDRLTSSIGSIKLKRDLRLHNSPIANRTRAKLCSESKRRGKKVSYTI